MLLLLLLLFSFVGHHSLTHRENSQAKEEPRPGGGRGFNDSELEKEIQKRFPGSQGNDYYHQEFQVPKMEVLNLVRLFWGEFSLTSALHMAYIGEYLDFRYLTCLVIIK